MILALSSNIYLNLFYVNVSYLIAVNRIIRKLELNDGCVALDIKCYVVFYFIKILSEICFIIHVWKRVYYILNLISLCINIPKNQNLIIFYETLEIIASHFVRLYWNSDFGEVVFSSVHLSTKTNNILYTKWLSEVFNLNCCRGLIFRIKFEYLKYYIHKLINI